MSAGAHEQPGDLLQGRDVASERASIDRATGVIMTLRRCPPEEACAELMAVAQQAGVEVVDLAEALVAGIAGAAFPREGGGGERGDVAQVAQQSWLRRLPRGMPGRQG